MTARLDAWTAWTGTFLLALLPLAFALRASASLVPIAIAFLWGLYLLIRRADLRRTVLGARAVLTVCLLVLVYAGINILGHGLGWHALDLPSHMVLFAVISVLFALPLRERVVWFGFSTTAAILGLASAVQHYVMGMQRSYGLNGGHWGAIEFAMLLLVLSLLALSQVLDERLDTRLRGWHGVCAALGIMGALLTQSRGPFAAMILATVLLAWLHVRRVGRRQGSMLMLAGVFLVLLVTGLSLHGALTHRFELGGRQAMNYSAAASAAAPVGHVAGASQSLQSGSGAVQQSPEHAPDMPAHAPHQGHAPHESGSVSARLQMWSVAWHGFVTHPLFGVGLDRFGAYSRAQIAAGHADSSIAQFNHPHDEYLEAAVTGGVPGLLILLLVFLVPLIWFARHAMDVDFTVAVIARGGILVVVMYMLCALTDNVFYRAMPHSLYFFMVTGFAVWIVRRLQDRGDHLTQRAAAT